MKSLKMRSIIIICVVTVLCLTCMAFVTYNISSTKVQDLSVSQYQTSTANTTNQLKAWLTEQEKLVSTQTMTLQINQNFEKETLAAYLTKIVEEYNKDGYIYDLYYTSKENVMASGSGYVPDGSIDFTKRDWYLPALESDDVCYSTPYKDTDSGKLVITLSQNVKKDGEIQGVMAADIFVDTLIELVGEQSVPKDSYCFLVDSANGVVTHPDKKGFAYVEDEPIALSKYKNKNYKKLLTAIKKKQEVVSFSDYDGMNRTFYLHKIDGCNWYVVTAVSDAVLSAQTSSLRNVYIIILLISILVVIVIVTLLAGSITKPIRKLTTQIQQGSMNQSDVKSSTKEIGQLYTEYNHLMGNLSELLSICSQAEGNLGEFGSSIEDINSVQPEH